MTQLFLASTMFGAVTVSAAIDAGLFDGRPEDDGERILVVTSNAAAPEAADPLDVAPGFSALRPLFDRVVDWNDAIAPFHPSSWHARPEDRVLWWRFLRDRWGIDGPVTELVVESMAVPPARSLCEIFDGAGITCYADGLMSYGPTRNRLPLQIGRRISRLLHPDLLPGVEPLLLTEFAVPAIVISDSAMRRTFDLVEKELPSGLGGLDVPPAEPRPAMVVGQYLAALGIVTDDEEDELHSAMVRALVDAGHRAVVFKPHPLAPARTTARLAELAATAGIAFGVIESSLPAEACFHRLRPVLVVGCFSTALTTAARYFDIPVARFGTSLVLARLTPYQNNNRIPVTLVDATVPSVDGEAELLDLSLLDGLLATVGYCMQPSLYGFLRPQAVEFLTWHRDARTARYLRRRRLTKLGLPGRDPLVRRLRARPRRTLRSAHARARKIKRAWRNLATAVVRG
ncbi:MAG TPA: polysialyltransferase family glycosyltransferase [Actinopolymorphaceae bacterium]